MTHRVFLTVAAAAFAAALAPQAAGSAADPRAALARYSAFIGHPEGVVVTYRYRRPASAAPAPSPSPGASLEPAEYTTYRRGVLYREVDGGQGVNRQSGFSGRAFWHANENHFVVLVLENGARRALTANAIDSGVFDATTDVQDRGSQTIDGKHVDIVRVTPRGGVPADLALDPETGALVQAALDPDDGRFVQHTEAYKEVAPGVRVPSVIRVGRDTRYFLTRGEARAITDDELKAPAPTSTWSFGSGESVPIEVERRGSGSRAVIVQASINGHPGRFLLDSGASQILLYRPYADQLGLTMLGNTAYSGINGGIRSARWGRANTVSVGDNTLSNVILSVSSKEPTFRSPISGILGFDLLAGAVVHVNLAEQSMAFADPAHVQPVVAKGAYAFPVNLTDNTPEITLKAGDASTRATFDTGDDFFAVLSDNLVTSGRIVALPEELKFASVSIDMTMFFGGVDGVSQEPASCHRLREISVGPYRYQNVTTCFASQRVFGRDGGLIGFDFLRHFNWTFDYTRSRLVLTPNGL